MRGWTTTNSTCEPARLRVKYKCVIPSRGFGAESGSGVSTDRGAQRSVAASGRIRIFMRTVAKTKGWV